MSTAKATSDQPIAARLVDQRRKIERAKIVWDTKLWPRQVADAARVKEFAALYKDEGPEALPIIKVAEHPKQKGKYLGIDGWHRNAAQEALKWKETEAEVYASDTDIFAEATRLSSISSKPLTILEKRAAVRKLLKQHSDWSDNKIARIAGVSHTFVGSQRKELRRLGGELLDAGKKFFTPDGKAASTASPTSTARENAPAPDADKLLQERLEKMGMNDFLLLMLEDASVFNTVTLPAWQQTARKKPSIRRAMHHVGTVLVQASQEAAPATLTSNVASQKTGARNE